LIVTQRKQKVVEMPVNSDARRLTLPVTVFGSVVIAVFSGTWWLSTTLNEIARQQDAQSTKQAEIAASVSKIDGRTEAFPVIARRVDGLEQSTNGLANNMSQMQLDVRTLQLQIEENRRTSEEIKRAQAEDRAITRTLSEWRTNIINRGTPPQP
jgi:septal ring factor EnvC (AmiA/AmiB activator)